MNSSSSAFITAPLPLSFTPHTASSFRSYSSRFLANSSSLTLHRRCQNNTTTTTTNFPKASLLVDPDFESSDIHQHHQDNQPHGPSSENNSPLDPHNLDSHLPQRYFHIKNAKGAIIVAAAPAINSLRPQSKQEQRQNQHQHQHQHQHHHHNPDHQQDEYAYMEQQKYQSETPRILQLLPGTLLAAGIAVAGYLGVKQLLLRQARLVEEFGPTLVLYGTSKENMREIVKEYRGKLFMMETPKMFKSYTKSLLEERPVGVEAIEDLSYVVKILKISNDKIVISINELATDLTKAPSLLGKLLFLVNRALPFQVIAKLKLMEKFPYSEDTVMILQDNMLDRCFEDLSIDILDQYEQDEPELCPLREASVLGITANDAKQRFANIIQKREQKRLQEEADRIAAQEAEKATPTIEILPEREQYAPSKQAVASKGKAYECTACGYTLFPAAGREFKFYGDDFKCPGCGASKDQFRDASKDSDDEEHADLIDDNASTITDYSSDLKIEGGESRLEGYKF